MWSIRKIFGTAAAEAVVHDPDSSPSIVRVATWSFGHQFRGRRFPSWSYAGVAYVNVPILDQRSKVSDHTLIASM
jgi:hypothetical protein